jgi:hypothetical protein
MTSNVQCSMFDLHFFCTEHLSWAMGSNMDDLLRVSLRDRLAQISILLRGLLVVTLLNSPTSILVCPYSYVSCIT